MKKQLRYYIHLTTTKDLVTGDNSFFESKLCNFIKSFMEIIISNVLLELIKTKFFKKINFKLSFPPEKYICSSLYFRINTVFLFRKRTNVSNQGFKNSQQRQFIYGSLQPLKIISRTSRFSWSQ